LENAFARVRLNYNVLWDCFWLCMHGTMAITDILTQASMSHLGESSRSSPWLAESSRFERWTILLRREGLASARNRGKPVCFCWIVD